MALVGDTGIRTICIKFEVRMPFISVDMTHGGGHNNSTARTFPENAGVTFCLLCAYVWFSMRFSAFFSTAFSFLENAAAGKL